VAVDLGASTGGFTDCLLQNGAARVYAVDVDPRQLDWGLQKDPRVVGVKKNARYLTPDDLPSPVDLAVMDLSFISVLKVLPVLPALMADGPVIALIKPQFEVGRGLVGKKGVVRNPDLHQVLLQVADGAEALGFGLAGCMPSPILGQKGNREFFVLWVRGPSPVSPRQREFMIKESVAHEDA
jgi:23S rRNA (cytidine1920-2'-O)/16S rRNA (cytidine1409-2'-O)-methyltransferase